MEVWVVNDTIFRDVPWAYAIAFLALLILVIPFLNPPEVEDEAAQPGNLAVQIEWAAGTSDVDLHVLGPNSPRDVYYNHKSGPVWNLLRDDLGNPDSRVNYENAYTRGRPAGRYVINARCYRCEESEFPILVEVSVLMKRDYDSTLKKLYEGSTFLLHDQDEVTLLQFEMDEDGNVVPESKNTVYVPMWGVTGSTH